MNKPVPDLRSVDDDLGPLDKHGQQIWSPKEEAAITRLTADPEYWAGVEEGLADIAAGRCYTPEEVATHMADLKQRWLAERGL
ncbi:hypothetical protein [Sphingomonas psychrolutea]|uniref:CopG family transcriptional regulator n=1 Tax=Sphingomonas psychrolutea TaxID=1259676 RepID=A0ABQ1H1F0_9SPHN|nr:hypothetical protein [Sphingomonas psychrolutea]GGA55448.1 hypothetical protein GCM10011395_27310 [Sphingomonas psychrolutea]